MTIPSGMVAFLMTTTMPFWITKPSSSRFVSTRWSLFTIRTLRPMRAFLSTMARWIVVFAPMPRGTFPCLEIFRTFYRGFVVVCPHHQRILDHTAGFDAGSDAYDRSLDRAFLKNTSLAEHGLDHLAVEQLRGRQVARPRVDRRLFIIETKRRIRLIGER